MTQSRLNSVPPFYIANYSSSAMAACGGNSSCSCITLHSTQLPSRYRTALIPPTNVQRNYPLRAPTADQPGITRRKQRIADERSIVSIANYAFAVCQAIYPLMVKAGNALQSYPFSTHSCTTAPRRLIIGSLFMEKDPRS
jgi:hypothetical protein